MPPVLLPDTLAVDTLVGTVSSATAPKAAKPLSPMDSLRLFYKFYETPSLFATPYLVRDSMRDMLYHRFVEDYFAEQAHFYLRDKSEFGQINELLYGGLGMRQQHILLDEILLNDPVMRIAPFNFLSSESFSRLSFFTGYRALAESSAPQVLESHTQRLTALKGYVKARYFQFAGITTKFDFTFSLNLSERLNFYAGYKYEGTDGNYSNLNAIGIERFGSNSLGNYIRSRLRYHFSERTFATLAIENHTVSMLPFGGIDLMQSLGFIDRLDSRNAVIVNQFTRRDLFLSVIKGEFQTALPFMQDSLNLFKVWAYLARFERKFVKTRPDTVYQILPFSDLENTSRLGFGAKQALKLWILSLQGKATLLFDRVHSQNTLRNSAGDTLFLPTVATFDLNAGGKLRLEKLLFGQDLEVGGALSWLTTSVSQTGGNDFTGTALNSGFGGEIAFPLPLARSSSLGGFLNASFTTRFATLQEVFSRDDRLQGSLDWQSELIRQFEAGSLLQLDSLLSLRVSFLNNQVFSPIAVVQALRQLDTVRVEYRGEFRPLKDLSLTYTGVGISLKTQLWKLEGFLDATFVLNYTMVPAPDREYEVGFTFQRIDDFIDTTTSRIFYLPRIYGSFGLFFHDKLFRGALDLKIGFAGFAFSDFSASLRNSERQTIFYFNLYERGRGEYVDNNLQFGVQGLSGRVDFQVWAKIGSATAFLMWENLPGLALIRAPIFPLPPRAIRFGISWLILN
ncbi:MAG: hypothetical protein RMI34_08075 [Chloroherpetonaceae bacterium]|nr:putative porin [Chloroherpetonaceae bacterium]MCS7210407.1 putative porin [Chloroherpetonaceae bacterium]MDW8020014.1 hypothetical protein [Chloroherpetonaceae bacterium]